MAEQAGTSSAVSPPAAVAQTSQKPKQQTHRQKKPQKPKQKLEGSGGGPDGNGNGGGGGGGHRLRGLQKDSPDVRLSKTLSWLLRHAAAAEGLQIRRDGYVRVDELVKHGRLQPLGLTLEKLQEIVRADAKQRYSLVCEQEDGTVLTSIEADGNESNKAVWLIKANQGHSLNTVELELKPIQRVEDIPSRIAVHGTTRKAWQIIQTEGLSRMKRNHIHLAQGVGGGNVISGMRKSSQVLIFINVAKALDAGMRFYLSDNGVVLTEGDERGYLVPEYFERVEDANGVSLTGWERKNSGDEGVAVVTGST